MRKNILWELALVFMKIGLFTFGGGYAMIAMMEDLCVEKKQWITHDEMMDVTVIAESTPGPIAINCATYVGYRQAGLIGSIVTTLAIIMPSACIIFLISIFFDHFLEIQLVSHAFKAIKIAVGILIFDAGVTMLHKMPKTVLARSVAGCAFAAIFLSNLFAWNLSSVSLMLIAAAVSLAVFLAKKHMAPKAVK